MALPDQVKVPYQEGYDYGIGVNITSGGAKSRVVRSGADVTSVEGNPGGTYTFEVTRVKTVSEIEEILGISARFGAGFAAFGLGAEARFSFARRARVENTSLVMLVTSIIQTGHEQIDEPRLTDEADKVAKMNDKDYFAERYGNMFVRGITGGGLFAGYLRIQTGRESISESIAAQLRGSYGVYSGDAKFRFDSVTEEYQSEIDVKVHVEGGPILPYKTIDDPRQMLVNLNKFLESFQANPDAVRKPYSVTLAPIAIAKGGLQPPNSIQLETASDVLIFCARRRSELIDKLNRYEVIVENPDRFDFSNGAKLSDVQAATLAAQEDLDFIARCASNAMTNTAKACMPATFAKQQNVKYPKLVVPTTMPKSIGIELITKTTYLGSWVSSGPIRKLTIRAEDQNFYIIMDRTEVDWAYRGGRGKWYPKDRSIKGQVNFEYLGYGMSCSVTLTINADRKHELQVTNFIEHRDGGGEVLWSTTEELVLKRA